MLLILNQEKMKAEETQTILRKLRRLEGLLKANTEVALSISKAVKYTGLSKSHLYKLTSTQAIPHYKPHGKLIFFRKSELDKYLFNNKISTQDELDRKTASILVKLKR